MFAERLVTTKPNPWVYLATAQAFDDEMKVRIAEHRDRRDAAWETVDAPLELPSVLRKQPKGSTVLIDCATLWLSNLLLAGHDLERLGESLVNAIAGFDGSVVVVSNEVGQGIVPDNALARQFRDAQGRLNQALAAQADLAVLVAAGLPLVLKGALPPELA